MCHFSNTFAVGYLHFQDWTYRYETLKDKLYFSIYSTHKLKFIYMISAVVVHTDELTLYQI